MKFGALSLTLHTLIFRKKRNIKKQWEDGEAPSAHLDQEFLRHNGPLRPQKPRSSIGSHIVTNITPGISWITEWINRFIHQGQALALATFLEIVPGSKEGGPRNADQYRFLAMSCTLPLSANFGVRKFCWLALFKTANCHHACLPVLKFTGRRFFKLPTRFFFPPVGKRFKEFSFKRRS